VISYAQNFEDVMLARALGDRAAGFYVDIGACHPDSGSVTRHFYELGWSGINVEPMSAPFAELVAARARDINVRAAIASYDGELAMYEGPSVGESSALRPYDTAQPILVPCMTLATLCRAHATRPIDFLKIDVEGLERDVIAGGDWTAFRPTVVVIEVTMPWSTRRRDDAEEIADFMRAYRYDEVYFDGLNAFFLAREGAPLAARFAAPPNVLDRFVLASEAEQVANAKRQQAHVDVVEKRLAEVREHSELITQRLGEVQAYAEGQRAALEASEQEAHRYAAREIQVRGELAEATRALQGEQLRAEKSLALVKRRLARALQLSQARIARATVQSNARVARLIRASKRNTAALAQAAQQARAAAEAASMRAASADAQVATLESARRGAEHAAARATAEFQHAASVAGQAHARVVELEAHVRQSEDRHRDAMQRALQAEHTIGSMLGSRSWRITAPLRSLGKLFRRAPDAPQPPEDRARVSVTSLRAAALRRGRMLAKRTPLYHWLAPRLKVRYPALWARARSVVVENSAPPEPPLRVGATVSAITSGAVAPLDDGPDSAEGIAARIRQDIARRRGA
jgi:FkbM family methyltransferase